MRALKILLNHFRRDASGNTAMIFALCALAMIILIGGGLDFSRYLAARMALQDATDVAVLQGALTASLGDTLSTAAADKAFSDNFSSNDISGVTHTLTRTVSGTTSTMRYDAAGTVTPYFLQMAGLGAQTISVSSTAQSQVNPFELALVLDTTGSMASDNKMTYLKSSVTAVLSSLLDASGANSANVKVGIVPFNTQVRMATSSTYPFVDYSQCYLRTTVGYYACLTAWKSYQAACATATAPATCLTTAASRTYYRNYTSAGTTYASAATMAYEKTGSKYTLYTYTTTTYIDASTHKMITTAANLTTTTATSVQAWTNYAPSGYSTFSSGYLVSIAPTWAGCLVDRNQAYDVSADAFNADIPDSYYIAAACDYSTLKASQDMTTSISTARTFVNALTTNGNTNITAGVQFGMEMLSPPVPFSQGVAFGDPDMAKYMIIVTDGDNTANRWTTTTSSINARTALACAAAKANDITLFVVRVEDGDSDLLKTCASKTSYYYDLSSSSQLTATMADIFAKIGKLRITQ